VLITGCSAGGIGFHFCEEFLARGCTVYATSRRLDSMKGLLQPPGCAASSAGKIYTRELDVTIDESVERVTNEIIEEAGKIDIVVSNAGYLEAGAVLDTPMDQVQKVFDTNTYGTLRLARSIIPHMASRRSGRFIIMGSVSGLIPTPWSGIYCASKAALKSIADSLRMECAPLGIKVTLLATGSVKSELAKNTTARYTLPEGSLYKDFSDAIVARIWSSQNPKSAMPTEVFVKKTVDQIMKKNPPGYLSIGGFTWLYYILLWLPRWVAFAVSWRLFGFRNKSQDRK